ncbi:MBL fold metallo-hydrolase [Streptomyces sp. 1222.5]|uniref:MBL fold metallo-hydrolase n=1 Tax=Streptomyces sp. 1222.5 TaxID=1881026 RepID=UPI003EB7022F
MDNTYDALLEGSAEILRSSFGAANVPADHFQGGTTTVGLMAEHGFSALITVRNSQQKVDLLFDAGLSPYAVIHNSDRIGVDLTGLQGVVLSHGHCDHAGGLSGLAQRLGQRRMPMVVHPGVWTRRRLTPPRSGLGELPTLSRHALAAEGFEIIERRQPSLLVDHTVLVTGEVDRTTEFEHGMPTSHQAWNGNEWFHDPLVIDDQALVILLRNQGLVVITGCGHAGVINILRQAQRLTGTRPVHALIGGLHLSGPFFEPIIAPTIAALADISPRLISSGHCTGWRAQHALAAAFPYAWVPSSSGTTYRLTSV